MNPSIKHKDYISSGAFGDVYKIVTKENEVFALKAFKNLSDEEAVRKEVNNLCKLQHRHIVRIYGCCFVKKLSMLMEYCPSNLKKAIKEGLRPYRAFRLFCEILEGIDFIHKQHMVHNDLKPDNILLDHRDSVKIGDFGLARQCDYSRCRGSVQGANLYLSPEALKSTSPIYSSKEDMYAIGIILFEMYSSCSSSNLIQKLKSDPKRISCEMFSKIGENISPIKYEIVLLLLCKHSEQRPSAGHLIRTFKESGHYSKHQSNEVQKYESHNGSSHHGSSHHGSGSHGSSHHSSSHHGSSHHGSGSHGSRHHSSDSHGSSHHGSGNHGSSHHGSSSHGLSHHGSSHHGSGSHGSSHHRSSHHGSSHHGSGSHGSRHHSSGNHGSSHHGSGSHGSSHHGSGHHGSSYHGSSNHSPRTPQHQSNSSRRSESRREEYERELALANFWEEQHRSGSSRSSRHSNKIECDLIRPSRRRSEYHEYQDEMLAREMGIMQLNNELQGPCIVEVCPPMVELCPPMCPPMCPPICPPMCPPVCPPMCPPVNYCPGPPPPPQGCNVDVIIAFGGRCD